MVIKFKANKEHKFHLSVVGILLNEKGEIGCHYFEQKRWDNMNVIWEDVYMLPSETVEPDESLTEAVLRGAEEECNAFCDVQRFLGVFCYTALAPWGNFEKALVYFALKIRVLTSCRSNERGAVLRFLSLHELIDRMESQREREATAGVDGLEGLYRYAELIESRSHKIMKS